ncbi:MAG: 1-deoxy-D-xylulose-5-phosphate reductoisomerase [Synergistales bacterium]
MNRRGILPRGIAVIGATGSVGTSVLDICRKYRDRFPVVALAGFRNVSRMALLALEFSPRLVAMADPEAAHRLRSLLPETTHVLAGPSALMETALFPDADHIVFASSGTAAIPALMSALREGKTVSLANKESLVIAGPWVMPLVAERQQLRPLDSEHNAVWQCLAGEGMQSVREIVLTASGGPFRTLNSRALEKVTPKMALNHPVWAMGSKITIDSATLMNKGLEILEAMQLFSLPSGRVRALVHPQSLVHGMALFSDGTLKWLLSSPDMRIPAAVALAFPERLDLKDPDLEFPPLDRLALSFEPPDPQRFPCLSLAMQAAQTGGAAPAILVGADEIAVTAFLGERISFPGIPRLIEDVLASFADSVPNSAEEAIAIMEWSRRKAQEILGIRELPRRSTS